MEKGFLLGVLGTFGSFALQHFDCVRYCGEYGGEGIGDGFGASGEVYYEAGIGDAGESAGDHGAGSFFEAFSTHGFGEAGELAVYHVSRGLGSDVARGDAGAAGGDDEVVVAGEVSEGVGDEWLFVGDGAAGGDADFGFFERLYDEVS